MWKPGRKKFLKGGQTAAACCSGGGGAGAPGQDRGQLDRGIIRRTPGGSLAQLAAAFAAGGNAMSSFQVCRLFDYLKGIVSWINRFMFVQSSEPSLRVLWAPVGTLSDCAKLAAWSHRGLTCTP